MPHTRHHRVGPRRGATPAAEGTTVAALLARLDRDIPEPRPSSDSRPWRHSAAPVTSAASRPNPRATRVADILATPAPIAEVGAPAAPKQHRSAPAARRPMRRSLAGALTVLGAVGAVGGIEFGASALFGDHPSVDAAGPADAATSPSALSTPQAAGPANTPASTPAPAPPGPPPAVAEAIPGLPTPRLPVVNPGDRPARPGAAARPVSSSCVAPAGMTSLIDQDPTDEQVPWRRTGSGKVPVYFAVGGMPADWRKDMEYGAAQWNKSPCIDTRVVNTCPSGANCVTVTVKNKLDADGNFDAIEKGGFTTGGHIDLLNTLTTAQRKNVAVHEMGHAIGLKHRKTNKVLMNGDTYDDVFDPDATEFRNLLFAYGKQRPANTE